MKRIAVFLICIGLIGISFVPHTVSDEPVRGITLYVGGSGPGNYTMIQNAIDDASAGETVFVYNGTYFENVIVNKTIDVIGEERNNTIIECIIRLKKA